MSTREMRKTDITATMMTEIEIVIIGAMMTEEDTDYISFIDINKHNFNKSLFFERAIPSSCSRFKHKHFFWFCSTCFILS